MHLKDKILSEDLFLRAEESLRLSEADVVVERKLRAIIAYKYYSGLEVAKRFKVSDRSIYSWIKAFKQFGVEGLEKHKKLIEADYILRAEEMLKSENLNREIEFKLKVIASYKNNTRAEVARIFNVTENIVLRWIEVFRMKGVRGLEKPDKSLSEDLFLQAEAALKILNIEKTIEEKLKFILAYRTNSISEVARMFNISRKKIDYWIKEFRKKGVEGLKFKERKDLTILESVFRKAEESLKLPNLDIEVEQKLKAIAACKNNTKKVVATMFHVEQNTILNWIRLFQQHDIKGLERYKKSLEDDYLMKAEETLALPNLDAKVIYKLKAIVSLKDNTFKEVAKIFGLPESTVFRWRELFKQYGVSGLEEQGKSIDKNIILKAEECLKLQDLNKGVERKLKAIISYGSFSSKETAKMFDVTEGTVLMWCRVFKNGGVSALAKMRELLDLGSVVLKAEEALKLPDLDKAAQQKLKAIMACRNNSVSKVATMFNVNPNTIYEWRKVFNKLGIKALEVHKKFLQEDYILEAESLLELPNLDKVVERKLRAIVAYKTHTGKELEKMFNVVQDTILIWIQLFKKEGIKGLETKTRKDQDGIKALSLQAEKILKSPNLDEQVVRKLRVIIAYRDNLAKEVEKMFNVNTSTISRWIELFKQKGIKGLEVQKKSLGEDRVILQAEENLKLAGIDDELARKLKAIIACKDNKTEEVGKMFNVSGNTILRWYKTFKQEGVAGLRNKKEKMVFEDLAKKAEEALLLDGIDEKIENMLEAISMLGDDTTDSVAKTFDVSVDTLLLWVKSFRLYGIKGLSMVEMNVMRSLG